MTLCGVLKSGEKTEVKQRLLVSFSSPVVTHAGGRVMWLRLSWCSRNYGPNTTIIILFVLYCIVLYFIVLQLWLLWKNILSDCLRAWWSD